MSGANRARSNVGVPPYHRPARRPRPSCRHLGAELWPCCARRKTLRRKRKLKLHIFATLMQERAAFYSLEGVRAFNLIDVVYYDCLKVRDCWAEFLQSLDRTAAMPGHVQTERFRKLLEAMAGDLDLGAQLRPDDFARTYYPTAIEEDDKVKDLQRKQMLANLQGQSPSANGAPSQWPPKPPKKT